MSQFAHLLLPVATMAGGVLRPKTIAVAVLGGLVLTAACNALYWQDGEHPASVFAMRDSSTANSVALRSDEQALATAVPAGNATRIVFEDSLSGDPVKRIGTPLPQPMPATKPVSVQTQAAAPTDMAANSGQNVNLASLQTLLGELGFYNGAVDGKSGPMTRKAIADYKKSAGLEGIDLSIDQLTVSARNNLMVTAAIPETRPLAEQPTTNRVETVVFRAPGSERDAVPVKRPNSAAITQETVRAVQQALRTHTRREISVDGVFGSQTSRAIAEFQSAYKLNASGQIDDELLNAMRSVNLLPN